jgi:hypothetical protein
VWVSLPILSPDLRVDRILPSTVRNVNDSSYVTSRQTTLSVVERHGRHNARSTEIIVSNVDILGLRHAKGLEGCGDGAET